MWRVGTPCPPPPSTTGFCCFLKQLRPGVSKRRALQGMAFQPPRRAQQKPQLPGAQRLLSQRPGLLGAQPAEGGQSLPLPCRNSSLPCALPGGKGQGPLPSPGRSFFYKGKGSGVIEQCPVPSLRFLSMKAVAEGPVHWKLPESGEGPSEGRDPGLAALRLNWVTLLKGLKLSEVSSPRI